MQAGRGPDVEALPARAPRRDAERNRRRIIEAAREVFALRGLDAGFNEIARHAGLGVGTVYRRFPDKETLVEAVLEDDVTARVDLIEECFHAAHAWDGVGGLLHVVA